MTPDQLANNVAYVVDEAQKRIRGIGAQQYHEPGKPQKFERMSLDGLIEYFTEELLDQINYSVMNILRLRQLQAALNLRMTSIVSAASDPESEPSKRKARAIIHELATEFNREHPLPAVSREPAETSG